MEVIFINAAGQTLFVRDDMESGHWIQQEYNVTADFPFDPSKLIQNGQRMAFRDPATDIIEVFEIQVVRNHEAEGFQQITANHICISELHDEHINKAEISDKTAGQALTTVLTGTLWSLGNNTASGTGNADISRGTVWDAVITIQQTYNVWITPRIVISAAGTITGRYLDIAPAEGVWRGLRLSIRKDIQDPIVTYDEENVYTALYGYGANVDKPQTTGDDKTEELTFKDIIWTQTAEHPAKPANQTYLEWPEKTAIYGRNGRPRFGYYQNGSIKDANTLLEKTWESLKKSCEPLISISGTVTELYRLGYKGQPVRLHDMAIVEIEETGEQFYKLITCNDVDLVNPDGTRPEIGDYIPNIVYINRDTDKKASGGGGSGRGRGSMTNLEDDDIKYYTEFFNLGDRVGLIVGTKDGTDYIKADQISLSINQSTGESVALIRADHIVMEGQTTIEDLLTGVAEINVLDVKDLYTEQLVVDLSISAGSAEFDDGVTAAGYYINGNNNKAVWQNKQISTPTFGTRHYFLYAASSGSTTPTGTTQHYPITGHTEATIHYLGSADT